MQKIIKNNEPAGLLRWKRQNPHKQYRDVDLAIRRDIRSACIAEQFGLCAFCCAPVHCDGSHNAHLFSQDSHPQKSLEWDNIVVSCNHDESCGRNQGTKSLPITPLMDECETEILFYQSGKIKGLTARAQETIRILQLDSDALKLRRKRAIDAFLYSTGYFPPEQDVLQWGEELWEELCNVCLRVDEGKMAPYAPILASIVRHMLREAGR